MATKLQRLLDSIDPARTLAEVDARVDEAFNSCPASAARITEWEEFRTCLVRFLRHVEARVLRLRTSPSMSLDFDWRRCVASLHAIYGRSGEKAAFELARTGAEDGLYGVLKALARQIAQQYASNEIRGRIGIYWDGLTTEERLAAASEYLGKFGHLLPAELVEGSAARVRANLPAVLEEHPRLLQRTRRVGR